MKCLATLCLLSLIINLSFAQSDTASQKFIRDIISEKNIVYTDSLDQYTINKMTRAFNWKDKKGNRVMTYKKSDTPLMSITFTPEEINHINLELYKLKFHGWGKNLLQNSICIPADTIEKIFFDNYKDYGWPYFNKHYGKRYYSFSKPIFLRNGTVCLFYSGYHCNGRCGEGGVYIYFRVKGKWKQLDYLYVWSV